MTQPLEDLGRLEMVRGPGSALYGANAFSGVINIITPEGREVAGTKLSFGGGELETIRGDFRQAGVFGNDRFGYRLNVGRHEERYLYPLPDLERRHLAAEGVCRRHR